MMITKYTPNLQNDSILLCMYIDLFHTTDCVRQLFSCFLCTLLYEILLLYRLHKIFETDSRNLVSKNI